MIWGAMTAEGPGFLANIDGGMDGELYRSILGDELKKTIEWYDFDERNIIIRQDNDPKHKAKEAMNYPKVNNIRC